VPQARISVLGYANEGDRIVAEVMIANAGSNWMTLSISEPLRNQSGWVKAQTSSGETNYHIGGTNEYTIAYRPGDNTSMWVQLPSDTLQWQMAFKLRRATKREQNHWAAFATRKWRGLFFDHPWMLNLLILTSGGFR